jgi:predicted ATPase
MSPCKAGARLPAPFLQCLTLIGDQIDGRTDYPFDLPWLKDPDCALRFHAPVTVIVGENGTGKSTLLEAIAALSGYDEAAGGKGYRAGWLPKVTEGWFFKAETFFLWRGIWVRFRAQLRIFCRGAMVRDLSGSLKSGCRAKAFISWMLQDFSSDPEGFVAEALRDDLGQE